ncbi:MAG TPA: LemA family protein, partial [Burkholderiaceae bacterium]|nr:LemA family protein [Burkholderiaceae bacterium]
MSIGSAVLLGLVVLTLVYGVVIYNGLVQLKHNLAKAWANIDVLLKQRHDELPKLVEVCRQYKQFEQDTLARVTEARARVAQARETHDVPALGAAE